MGSDDQPGLAEVWNRTIQPEPMAWAVIKGVPSVNCAQVRLEMSADGSTWNVDFHLTYTRIG